MVRKTPKGELKSMHVNYHARSKYQKSVLLLEAFKRNHDNESLSPSPFSGVLRLHVQYF